MLIKMTVENFKSFNEAAELVMVSSSKIRRKEDHVQKLHGAKVLKYAAVYGANAAGKSNLIDVFRFTQQVLTQGLTVASSSLYCRNHEANRERASTFELQFSCNGKVLAYGFSAVLSKRMVREEWLYELGGAKPVKLLELDTSIDSHSISSDISFTAEESVRLKTYAEDFYGETNRLFLDELNRSKKYPPGSAFEVFERAYAWLMQNIVTVRPTQPPRDVGFLRSVEGVNRASRLLSSFDTGITELFQEQIPLDTFFESVADQYVDVLNEEMDARLRANPRGKVRVSLRTPDGFYFFDFDNGGFSNVSRLRLRHHNVSIPFDYLEESDGTKRLLDLMDILISTDDDVVYVVDELERSLHPMLVRKFLELFMEQDANSSRQLVFSTHEASIMDQDLFRRDEIWFVDRDGRGNSRLYSLDRFKERFDKDIAKAYLDGRYGAVPAFSDLGEA